MKIISLHEKVFNVVHQYPETRQIIIDLGLVHLKDDAMLFTAGKIMTLAKAARRHNLTYEDFKEAFESHGFSLKEESL